MSGRGEPAAESWNSACRHRQDTRSDEVHLWATVYSAGDRRYYPVPWPKSGRQSQEGSRGKQLSRRSERALRFTHQGAFSARNQFRATKGAGHKRVHTLGVPHKSKTQVCPSGEYKKHGGARDFYYKTGGGFPQGNQCWL